MNNVHNVQCCNVLDIIFLTVPSTVFERQMRGCEIKRGMKVCAATKSDTNLNSLSVWANRANRSGFPFPFTFICFLCDST